VAWLYFSFINDVEINADISHSRNQILLFLNREPVKRADQMLFMNKDEKVLVGIKP